MNMNTINTSTMGGTMKAGATLTTANLKAASGSRKKKGKGGNEN
jgi:hypothetical protein